MSMSTHVKGFRPPDEKWKKMKAAWDACDAAGIEVPMEVLDFFGHVAPDPLGIEVEVEVSPACRRYKADMRDGFEVDINKLPPGLNILRFYNSY